MNKEARLIRVLDDLTTANIETLEMHKRPHVDQLRQVIAQPNVVGVGIADKVRRGKKSPHLAIAVYVKKKWPLNELSPRRVIPSAIPEAVADATPIPTDVVVLGKFEAIGKLEPKQTRVFAIREPIQPGNSVGHYQATAGTLGAIVRPKMSGKKQRMILSNSHVLALCGRGKKGDRIIYPGKADEGKVPGDVIAHLHNHVKLQPGGDFINEVDCAVAMIDVHNSRPLLPSVRGCKAPKGTIVPKRGMKIRISGRTSGVSNGVIKDIHLRLAIPYPRLGQVGFKNLVFCTKYSRPGDSGSLVCDIAGGKAVGLHVAAWQGGSVFCPIQKVLHALGVELQLV